MAEARILVVGGAGYFGARLAEALQPDAELTLTQRTFSQTRSAWLEARRLRAVMFDSARHSVLPVEGRFDVVVNLAMPGAGEAARGAERSERAALTTAKACLALLDSGRADRVVHFSTFHVYGGLPRQLYSEKDDPAPANPYGSIHLAVERLLLARAEPARIAIVRPTNLVGAPAHADLGDQAKLLFVDLCRQAAGGIIRLNNDGLSYRDILPFDDAVAAVALLSRASLGEPGPYNLGSGRATRLDVIAETISSACVHPVSIEFGTGSDAYRDPFAVDISKLASLGWRPEADLAKEAKRCVQFFCA